MVEFWLRRHIFLINFSMFHASTVIEYIFCRFVQSFFEGHWLIAVVTTPALLTTQVLFSVRMITANKASDMVPHLALQGWKVVLSVMHFVMEVDSEKSQFCDSPQKRVLLWYMQQLILGASNVLRYASNQNIHLVLPFVGCKYQSHKWYFLDEAALHTDGISSRWPPSSFGPAPAPPPVCCSSTNSSSMGTISQLTLSWSGASPRAPCCWSQASSCTSSLLYSLPWPRSAGDMAGEWCSDIRITWQWWGRGNNK